MPEFTTEECGSCQAPIIWAMTEKAVRMPVDAQPASDGNVRLHDRGGVAPLAVVLKTHELFGKTGLRKSHFATCPDAVSWRRRPQKAGA